MRIGIRIKGRIVAGETAVPPLIVTADNSFFFEAARAGRLEFQRCTSCSLVRHPPQPSCERCASFEWDTVVTSGRGTLHSYTVAHRPQDAAFDYPLVIGLAQMEEGVRIVADMPGVDPGILEPELPLVVGFAEHAHGEILPVLRPESGR